MLWLIDAINHSLGKKYVQIPIPKRAEVVKQLGKNNFESKVVRSLKVQTRQKTLISKISSHTQDKKKQNNKSIDLDKTILTNFISKLMKKVDYLVI